MFGPSYEAGCPVNSSIADSIDGIVPHLNARDVTMILVSQAPLEKLQRYKRRMGWSIPWVSASDSDFNFDMGFSQTEAQAREAVAQVALPAQTLGGGVPTGRGAERPRIRHGHRRLSDRKPRVSARSSGTVTMSIRRTPRRGAGLEVVMTYYPILDHAPKGRDEGADDWQLWIRPAR
jgi:predicted dithiol-disulfide oxidoreductase (DUF899 family)